MGTSDDSKSLAYERFGRYAQRYVTSKDHAQGAELDRLIEIARPQPDWVVLDVATGGGHTALKFAPYVAHVIATDLAPKMLEAARTFITGEGVENMEFKRADAEHLPFDPEAFNLVTCRIAPHHFTGCFRFVRESARVLKPGGLLVVQDHVLPNSEDAGRYADAVEKLRDPSHNRAHTEPEWRGMFEDAGLTVVHTEQLIKRHDFSLWTERQGCSPEIIARLITMMQEAPDAAAQWMQLRAIGTPHASFVNHHIIIAGRK